MRARLEQGFWVFQAPAGYRYEKSKRSGKELVRDEPIASIIEEALSGYPTGRFDSQVEVNHEGLISVETFRKIQKRSAGHPKARARKNLNLDFPLRGFVTCGDCNKPLTACWSKGRCK